MANLDLAAIRKQAAAALDSGAECHPTQVMSLLDELEQLREECHGRRYDPNLVRENKELREQLAAVDSMLGSYDWAGLAEDAKGYDQWEHPLAVIARIEAARKAART